MGLSALFLDMDHTLCDTAKADELGLMDLGARLFKRGLPNLDEAQNFARYYMHLLYKGLEGFERTLGETELNYRARLLQFAFQRRHHQSLSRIEAEDLVDRLMAKRMEAFDFFEGVVALLGQLRQRYKLIVISNGPLFSQEPKVARVKLGSHVDHVVLAGALPWQKPDVKIFEYALSLENLAPEQVCHVGDSLASDIAGALAAEIKSVWVNAGGRRGPKEPVPHAEIATFCQLPKILEQFEQEEFSLKV
jgi:N-acylneuraminate-9-phosphatase